MRSARDRLALLAILSVAVANTGAQLGTQSLFVDEGATWQLEAGHLQGLVGRVRASEVAPPLYYALLHGWTHLWGSQSELVLRLPSAVCAVLAVLVVVRLGTTLVNRFVGLGAGLLLALSPALTLYGQLARAYGPVLLATALACLAAAELHRRPSRRGLTLLGLASLAALSLHYTAALVVLPLLVLMTRNHALPRAGRVAVLLPCAAVLAADGLLASQQTGDGRSDHAGAGLSWPSLGQVVGVPFAGRGPESWPSLVGAALVGLALASLLWRGNRELRLLALGAGLPLAAVVLATAAGHRAMWGRYVVVALPLLVVAVVAALQRYSRNLLLAAVALAVVGTALSHRPGYSYYGDTRDLIADAGHRWQASDALANLNPYRPYGAVVAYYASRDLPRGTPVLTTPQQVAAALTAHRRVWAFTSHATRATLAAYLARLHGQVVTITERDGASRPELVLIAPR